MFWMTRSVKHKKLNAWKLSENYIFYEAVKQTWLILTFLFISILSFQVIQETNILEVDVIFLVEQEERC